MLTMDAKWPLLIRDEQSPDGEQVRIVNEAAFGRSDEADLIERLRIEGAILLSLVAGFDRRIVGHILFSRMMVETEQGPVAAVSLAPMAVLPDYQGRQVGSHTKSTIPDLASLLRRPAIWAVRFPPTHSWHWNSPTVHWREFKVRSGITSAFWL
jgi:predicted N-acetyltransferase YhbS